MKYWNQTKKLLFMIHIGKIIKAEVEIQRLTQKEFGALIHKSVAAVQDIYGRATITTDLLITISTVLKKDFLKFFYKEEPFNALRDDEATRLKSELRRMIDQIEQLQKDLAIYKRVSEAQSETISLANECIDVHKILLKEVIDGTKAEI